MKTVNILVVANKDFRHPKSHPASRDPYPVSVGVSKAVLKT